MSVIPSPVEDRLVMKVKRLENELIISNAKYSQVQAFLLDTGLINDFIAWKVGKRMEGKQVD